MRVNTTDRFDQIAAIAAAMVLIAGCVIVLRPFVSGLLWAMILSYTTWPLFMAVERRLGGRRTLAATCMSILIAIVLLAPFVFLSLSLADDVRRALVAIGTLLRQGVPPPPLWLADLPLVGPALVEWWNQWAGGSAVELVARLQALLTTSGHWLLNRGVALGEGILQMTLSVLVAFFLFRDGATLVTRLSAGMQRLAGSRAQELLGIAGNTTKGVVYGVFGTALAQGACAALGFWIAGVPGAFLLGVGTCFLSLIPGGPPLIWLPASIWLFLQDSIGWSVFSFLWGLFVVSSVDNVLKPYLISRSGSLPFILVLLGILGGIFAFGFVGVFLGPILLAVGFAMLRDWTMLRRPDTPPWA